MSVLIVASRKHYSVDVVIAWYVVPLVYWTLQHHWTTKRRFSDSAASLEELAGEEDVEMGLPLKVGSFLDSFCLGTEALMGGGLPQLTEVQQARPVAAQE